LPDDDEETSTPLAADEPEAAPLSEPVVIASPASDPAVEAAPAPVVEPSAPPINELAPSRPSRSKAPAPAEPAKVPLTVRLHLPAASGLRDAWLEARRTTDATLSSPTFASEIVMLGLEAYRKKKR
jgi:hypothetical protein